MLFYVNPLILGNAGLEVIVFLRVAITIGIVQREARSREIGTDCRRGYTVAIAGHHQIRTPKLNFRKIPTNIAEPLQIRMAVEVFIHLVGREILFDRPRESQ